MEKIKNLISCIITIVTFSNASDITFAVTELSIDPTNIAGMETVYIHSDSIVLLKSGNSYYLSDIYGSFTRNIYTPGEKSNRGLITKDGKHIEIAEYVRKNREAWVTIFDLEGNELIKKQEPEIEIGWISFDNEENIYYQKREHGERIKIMKMNLSSGNTTQINYGFVKVSPNGKYLLSRGDPDVDPMELYCAGKLPWEEAIQQKQIIMEQRKSGMRKHPPYRILDTDGNVLLTFPHLGNVGVITWSKTSKYISMAKGGWCKIFQINDFNGELSYSMTELISPYDDYYFSGSLANPWSLDDKYMVVFIAKSDESNHYNEDIILALYSVINGPEVIPILRVKNIGRYGKAPKWIDEKTFLLTDRTEKIIRFITIDD